MENKFPNPLGSDTKNRPQITLNSEYRVSEQLKIVAFVCNWCAYAGADLAGVARLQYPTNVRLIRVMCTGRLNYGFLLKAFVAGADGVLVSG